MEHRRGLPQPPLLCNARHRWARRFAAICLAQRCTSPFPGCLWSLVLSLTVFPIHAATTFVFYGNHFDPNYVDRTFAQQDSNWNNPNNWLVYSPLGTVLGGGVPGGDPSDKVTIRSYGGAYIFPTNAVGTLAELHFIGPGACLPVALRTDISVIELLEISRTGGGAASTFGPAYITLGNLGTLLYEGGGNLGAAVIENHGLARAPGTFSSLDRGIINNHGGFELNQNAMLNTTVFNNVGRLEKIDLDGVTITRTVLTNTPTGVIKVGGGTLLADSGLLANEGELWAAGTNAVIEISGKARLVMSDGSRFKGPGTLLINSSMDVNADSVIENLDLRGEIRGPGKLELTGQCQFSFAGISGALDPVTAQVVDSSPVCVISNNASVVVRGPTYLTRQLENNGVLRIEALLGIAADSRGRQAALVNNPSGVIEGLPPGTGFVPVGGLCTNFGLARFRNGESVVGSVEFVNFGRIEVQVGDFHSRTFLQTTGTLNVATKATVTVDRKAEISGGVLSGEGTIRFTGPATIGAAIRPGAPIGRIEIDNNGSDVVACSPAAVVEIDVGGRIPDAEYDQLSLGGNGRTPTLAGILQVTLTNEFTPKKGDSFHVVTYAPSPPGVSVGTFSNYSFPTLPDGLKWVPRYDPDGLRLVIVEPLKLHFTVKNDSRNLTLAWPSSPLNSIVLEYSDTLSPSNWQPVTEPVQDDGTNMSVELSVSVTGSGKFFRLRNVP